MPGILAANVKEDLGNGENVRKMWFSPVHHAQYICRSEELDSLDQSPMGRTYAPHPLVKDGLCSRLVVCAVAHDELEDSVSEVSVHDSFSYGAGERSYARDDRIDDSIVVVDVDCLGQVGYGYFDYKFDDPVL